MNAFINKLKPTLLSYRDLKQWQQFLRFCSVGVVNTTVNYTVYLVLLWQHLHYLLAGACGYLTASIVGFYLNRRWTFRTSVALRAMFIYLAINAGSLLITLIIQWLVVTQLHVPAEISLVFAIVVTTFFNFVLIKKLIFNQTVQQD